MRARDLADYGNELGIYTRCPFIRSDLTWRYAVVYAVSDSLPSSSVHAIDRALRDASTSTQMRRLLLGRALEVAVEGSAEGALARRTSCWPSASSPRAGGR